jgi:putative membrane protein
MPSQQPQTNSSMGVPGMSPAPAGTPESLGDQAFVSKALEGGDAEVQLGQLAEQKSQSNDVKEFAQKMVADHTQMGDKLFKPIAKQLGLSASKGPSKKDKKLIAKLQGLSGTEFDTEYITVMLKDHQQDLKDFKSEAETAQDPIVKQAAQDGARVISQHLQMIEQIAQNHKVVVQGKSKEVSSMQ